MNNIYFLAQQTMFFSIPLLIVALGGMFSERGGIINIALEGIMILGAFSGVLFIRTMQTLAPGFSGQPLLIAAILVSSAVGVIASLPHAYASINMKANQVITGTALNMFAVGFVVYIARMINDNNTKKVGFTNQFRIPSVPLLGDIPVVGKLFFQNTYITTYLGLLILAASWVLLFKTRFGLRLRSCGEHPHAADSVGINVYKMRYAGTLLSGALAGLGGLVYIIPTTNEFDASVSGYGFLALAVLIFGQWKPVLILFAALFFGLMKAVSSAYSGIPWLANAMPSNMYKMIPFITTLVVLTFTSKRSQAPRAEGIPYDKGGR